MAAGEPDDLTPAQRLRVALELSATGVDLMRQNLRRQHPDASAERITALLQEWLEQRPGAEHGDGEGRPVSWPHRAA